MSACLAAHDAWILGAVPSRSQRLPSAHTAHNCRRRHPYHTIHSATGSSGSSPRRLHAHPQAPHDACTPAKPQRVPPSQRVSVPVAAGVWAEDAALIEWPTRGDSSGFVRSSRVVSCAMLAARGPDGRWARSRPAPSPQACPPASLPARPCLQDSTRAAVLKQDRSRRFVSHARLPRVQVTQATHHSQNSCKSTNPPLFWSMSSKSASHALCSAR